MSAMTPNAYKLIIRLMIEDNEKKKKRTKTYRVGGHTGAIAKVKRIMDPSIRRHRGSGT
jgi:hypothetical protein